jgi:hypothetical protein
MYVTVVDENDAPVESVEALRPGDFAIREDDDARQVLSVASADDPMQIAVLVDTTQAARDHIGDIRTALASFVTEMTRGMKHQLSMVGLGEQPIAVRDGSSDRDQIMKDVIRVVEQRGSGHYLLDALVQVSEGFKKRGVKRPVIVAITSERPELSSGQRQEVLKPLQESGAVMDVLVVGGAANGAGEAARSGGLLEEGPRTTGGRRDIVARSMLPAALERLANELTHQYIVAYSRPLSANPPARVTISATRPGLRARGTPVKEPAGQGRP